MSETWFQRAQGIIRAIDAALPTDADLKARRAALLAGRPYEYRVTRWGQQSWAKASKEYLARHGAVPRQRKVDAGDLPLFGPSPLERQKYRYTASGKRLPRVG